VIIINTIILRVLTGIYLGGFNSDTRLVKRGTKIVFNLISFLLSFYAPTYCGTTRYTGI